MRVIDFNLGDERLNQRGQYCLSKILQEPTLSFPDIFNQSKELQGFYRFINNSSFTSSELKESIFEETKNNIASCSEAIVIHDTTQVKLPSKSLEIPEFKFSKGFFAHLSLIVDAGKSRHIYGAGGLRLYSRTGKRITKGSTGEQHRWIEQAKQVELDFNQTSFIHVMDREGDMHEVWSELKDEGHRFVIRAKANRYVKSSKNMARLFEEITKVEPIAQRQVTLSKRKMAFYPGQRSAHKSREQREVLLNISAHSFEVHKTLHEKKAKKETVQLNIVRVFQEDDGDENPVEWILITNEPIATPEDALRVVDIYRTRWLIEEFFKGLKSGCSLESRLFSEAESWYKVITLLLPAATNILNLRICEDEVVTENPIRALNATQLKILAIKAVEFKKEFKTYKDIQYVLAQLGGHIITNGPPGWMTLLKGYRKLLNMEQGWLLAHRDM